MKGFIEVSVNNTCRYISIDSIRDFGVVDKYHPNENALIFLKDGSKIHTDWNNNVSNIAEQIALNT